MSARSHWRTLVLAAMLFPGAHPGTQPVTIHLIGDSTMADKPAVENPERGWGQMFPQFFDSTVSIRNYARNGRSTKSFIDEGRWDVVRAALKPGDYVFIQFGHNDAKKSDSTRYADPHNAYRRNLLRFVREARQAGATPVLITPVHRRKFDSTGAIVDQHGDYPVVVREVAREERVPLIDLHARSRVLFERWGPEGTKDLFLWIPPGRFAAVPQGKTDNTHFTPLGAVQVARLVADGIGDLQLPLAGHLRPVDPDALPGLRKIVALGELRGSNRRDSAACGWTDSTSSGFSRGGRVLTLLGATIADLRDPSDSVSLTRCGLVVLRVDHSGANGRLFAAHDTAMTQAVSKWVCGGGVLVICASGAADPNGAGGLCRHIGMTLDSKPLSLENIDRTAWATCGRGTVVVTDARWLQNAYIGLFDSETAGIRLLRWVLARAVPTDGWSHFAGAARAE